MNIPKVAIAMNNIEDALVFGAIAYENPGRKKNHWVKWGAAAACLCLIVLGVFAALTPFAGHPVPTEEQEGGEPLGQRFFDAVVLDVEGNTVLVRCTDTLQGDIPVGAAVQVSTDTLSDEAVPDLAMGDKIRVLYLGLTASGDRLVLENTVSIFRLDEAGEPIVSPGDPPADNSNPAEGAG